MNNTDFDNYSKLSFLAEAKTEASVLELGNVLDKFIKKLEKTVGSSDLFTVGARQPDHLRNMLQQDVYVSKATADAVKKALDAAFENFSKSPTGKVIDATYVTSPQPYTVGSRVFQSPRAVQAAQREVLGQYGTASIDRDTLNYAVPTPANLSERREFFNDMFSGSSKIERQYTTTKTFEEQAKREREEERRLTKEQAEAARKVEREEAKKNKEAKEEAKRKEKEDKEEAKKKEKEEDMHRRSIKTGLTKLGLLLGGTVTVLKNILDAVKVLGGESRENVRTEQVLNLPAGTMRTWNTVESMTGMQKGTFEGAVKGMLSKFGNIQNLDANALGALAPMLGGDVAKLIELALAENRPTDALYTLLNTAISRARKGETTLSGEASTPEAATAEWLAAIERISPEAASIFTVLQNQEAGGYLYNSVEDLINLGEANKIVSKEQDKQGAVAGRLSAEADTRFENALKALTSELIGFRKVVNDFKNKFASSVDKSGKVSASLLQQDAERIDSLQQYQAQLYSKKLGAINALEELGIDYSGTKTIGNETKAQVILRNDAYKSNPVIAMYLAQIESIEKIEKELDKQAGATAKYKISGDYVEDFEIARGQALYDFSGLQTSLMSIPKEFRDPILRDIFTSLYPGSEEFVNRLVENPFSMGKGETVNDIQKKDTAFSYWQQRINDFQGEMALFDPGIRAYAESMHGWTSGTATSSLDKNGNLDVTIKLVDANGNQVGEIKKLENVLTNAFGANGSSFEFSNSNIAQ